MCTSGLCSQVALRVACVLLLASCSTFHSAMAPALPFTADMPASKQIPDSVLSEAIRRGDLIVLATPLELASQHGFLTPRFQLGAKETWYDVKLTVDSVLKGKLKHARRSSSFDGAITVSPSAAWLTAGGPTTRRIRWSPSARRASCHRPNGHGSPDWPGASSAHGHCPRLGLARGCPGD
jgi:hypothetical protein